MPVSSKSLNSWRSKMDGLSAVSSAWKQVSKLKMGISPEFKEALWTESRRVNYNIEITLKQALS